jgi:transposase
MSGLFDAPLGAKFYVYSEPVNMCCSFNGLAGIVRWKMKAKPASGNVFVFMNKRRTYLKALYWQDAGWCIFAKRFPEGCFREVHGRISREGMSDLLRTVHDEIVLSEAA